MKLAIIQLSDIHVKTSSDPILQRSELIGAVIKDVAAQSDGILIGLTGDIAFSGRPEQYKLALEFVGRVLDEVRKTRKPIFLFAIPGNHDLDFSVSPDTREVLLQSVGANPEKVKGDGDTVQQILRVQEHFFTFEAEFLTAERRKPGQRIGYEHLFDVNGKTVRIKCYNTAWLSTNPEIPGRLLIPAQFHLARGNDVDLEIAAFHHPYNWFTPENAREFRYHIETSSDLVLTGHEHETSFSVKYGLDTESSNQYVEGSVLQDSTDSRSAFNVILIDNISRVYSPIVCRWSGELYKPDSKGEFEFKRNRLAERNTFRHTLHFERLLNTPALPIMHPHKKDVTLEDLFMYPGLAVKKPEKRFEVLRIVESHDVVEFFRTGRRIMVMGDETSGKTAIAKSLCKDLLTKKFVPVFLQGTDFIGYRDADIRKLLRAAVSDQYGSGVVEQFFQLDRQQRVIVVDDWQLIRYGAKGKLAIVENLKVFADKIFCFTSRMSALEELTDWGPARKVLADFEFCDIKEFGKRLTGKLIEKWYSLGQEYTLDQDEFLYKVSCAESKITAVVGKGIIPTYPIFLISLLQADSSASTTSQNVGSYGHVLESLITFRLSDVSSRSTDVGLMYTYLSRIAYHLFKEDRPFLSTAEISRLHTEYCTVYQMRISESKMIADLLKSKIILKDSGSFRFAYKGLYCYFVARFLQENMPKDEPRFRSELEDIADKIGFDDYSNIVMFYLYLSKDLKTIDRLLKNADKYFSEVPPANLETDVTFVDRLIKEKPAKLLLPGTDLSENRDKFREAQDRATDVLDSAPDQKVAYASNLNEIVKINIALQNLRVMGQVLRNFPGVLSGDPKFRLAEASYLLGLRILRRVLILAEQQKEQIRKDFAEILRERHPLTSPEELEQDADQKLIWLLGSATYGVIKRICKAVGLQDLELTFEQVREQLGETVAVRLIDLSIRLEHFREVPEIEIHRLQKHLNNNPFAFKVLRDLIAEFLYLYNRDSQKAQKLGDMFKIEVSAPEYLLNKPIGV